MLVAEAPRVAPAIGRAYVYQPWTATEEQFIIDSYPTLLAREQADHLGRDRSDVVAKRMRLKKKGRLATIRAYHPEWTEEDDEWLRDNYHRLTMPTLMRKLKRTECAIILRKRRLGIRRTDGFYTSRELARLFGCDSKKLVALYDGGYLSGKRAPYKQGMHRPWVFSEENVVKFLREYPWLLDVNKIQEEHLFRARIREEWVRDPWYNARQAAAAMGVNDDTILRRLRSGEIPAFQRSPDKPWSHWWIRRSSLLAHFRRHDTHEERSRMTANAIRERRERNGLPRLLARVWEVVCQQCAERYRVQTPPRGTGALALELASQQHQCHGGR